jgi:transposase
MIGRSQMDGKEEGRAVPATVSVPAMGAEGPVISRERWEALRHLRGEGQSVSEIARSTGLDRKTVRAALAKAAWTPYRRTPVAATLLSTHAAWVAERAPQVHYSARILFQELRAGRGYQGGYDTVRNAIRPLRAEAAVASLTQRRFETEPGEQAQVDWGQVRVRFESGPAAIHVFVMTLGFSRRAWTEGYEHERIDSLLCAHEHAFEHFGGHTAEILYDRKRASRAGTPTSSRSPGTGASSRDCAGRTARRPKARSSPG